MPVLSEGTTDEQQPRGWRWLLAAVPVLLVLFVVGPTIRPVVLESGSWVVCVGGASIPGIAEYTWKNAGGLPPFDDPIKLNGREFLVMEAYNIRSLHVGPWRYGTTWFKAHPRR